MKYLWLLLLIGCAKDDIQYTVTPKTKTPTRWVITGNFTMSRYYTSVYRELEIKDSLVIEDYEELHALFFRQDPQRLIITRNKVLVIDTITNRYYLKSK